MDLLCTEIVTSSESGESDNSRNACPRERPVRQALPDPALGQDRVLDNLLRAEERHSTVGSDFETLQDEITASMRKIVATWMLEVCQEQSCQEEVFQLAMTYLDRFLNVCRIGKCQLQLLGTVCLLLASKLREPSARGLPADMLVYYTDNSISLQDLCKWELLVLSKLKWDMATVTPQDFLALLLARIPLGNYLKAEMVIKHAQTFIALALREYHFTRYTASTLAAASLAAALRGLDWDTQAGVSKQELLSRLHTLTRIEEDYLESCMEQIEQMVQKTIDEKNKFDPNGIAGAALGDEMRETSWSQPQVMPQKHLDKAGTPTDVRDVHF